VCITSQPICSASPIPSHITNNLGSSGGETQIHDVVPLKFKENTRCHNTKTLVID
jgi:hypothetical protein